MSGALQLVILGSTGSIGRQTLSVISQSPERFSVYALVANQNVAEMLLQCQQYHPAVCVMMNTASAEELRQMLKAASLTVDVIDGSSQVLSDIVSHADVDIVVSAIVGVAGLSSTFAAAQAGKRILLANKESLVVAGDLLMETVRTYGASLLPIDSEHNAIFQCLSDDFLPGQPLPAGVDSVVLTSSGGPFRQWSLESLRDVTVEQALSHPNWSMGAKISIDSATMMNKVLEVIEAAHLFALRPAQIEVLVHPQSIVHSMVRYQDGSVLAQMGVPDMRTPIAHALAWPDRTMSGVKPIDFTQCCPLEFEPVDSVRFPCMSLAQDVLAAGGSAACVLNATNEVAVAAFLRGEIKFVEIFSVISDVLQQSDYVTLSSLDAIWAAHDAASAMASQICKMALS